MNDFDGPCGGLAALAIALSAVACGDSGAADGTTGGGGDATTASATGSDTDATSTATTSAVGSGGGATSGVGSCLAPRVVSLGFTAESDATTLDQLDTTAMGCSAAGALPEAVYQIDLTSMTTVALTANDGSGQGIGVEVRSAACDGDSVACDWASNGIVDRTYPLPAGRWVFIVERNPAGPFTLTIGP